MEKKRDWWGEDSKTVTTFDSEDIVGDSLKPPLSFQGGENIENEIRLDQKSLKKPKLLEVSQRKEFKEKEVITEKMKETIREESKGETIDAEEDDDEDMWLEDATETEERESLTPNKIEPDFEEKEKKIEEAKKKEKQKKEKNLSIVNEDEAESSEDNYDDKEFTSKINFDELCRTVNNTPLLVIQDEFLKIRDLRKEYIVHYIDKEDKDFDLACDFLSNQEYVSIEVEVHDSVPAYIQFATKWRAFVFNCHRLKQERDRKFKSFLGEFMKNKNILKIGYNTDRYLRPMKKLFNTSILFNNMLSIDSELFITNIPPELVLAALCHRVLSNIYIFFNS